jgi:hypothetical protein
MASLDGIHLPTPQDWVPVYVDGGPFTSFSKTIVVQQAIWYALLELEVLTGYDTFPASARVVINNQQVGTVEPRPTSRYTDLQPYSILFSTGLFNTGAGAPYNGAFNFRIEPVSSNDWLVVGHWRVHYQRVP